MQKYILISLIIIANLFGIYLVINKQEQSQYPEEVVKNITDNVNNDINSFLQSVFLETTNIKDEISLPNNFTHQNLDKYFIHNSGIHKLLYSVFIKKNDLFYIVDNEGETLKSAFDTLETTNIVRWNRYKNKKLVTSWTEVVQLDSVAYKWLNISERPNETINWGVGDGKKIEGSNILISSIKWKYNNDNYLIIYRYINGALNIFDNKITKYNNNIVLINTTNNNYIEFTKDTIIDISSTKLDNKKFAFEKTIIDYSKTLKNKNDSVFSFSYNDKLYWIINLTIDNKYGIKNFTLIIANDDIITVEKKNNLFLYIYLTVLFISIIIILVLLKIIKIKRHHVHFDSQDTLQALLKNDESRYLEFKSSLRWDFRQEKVNPDLENVILKTIAAFGNSDGGVLLIGVSDDKSIIGLDKDYTSLKQYGADFFEIYLRNILHKHMGVKYVTENLRITFHKFDEKEICKIEVFKASEPLYLTINKKGNITEKFYVRSGNSSNELSSLKDINDYIFNRFKK